jgi:hypothetical protein
VSEGLAQSLQTAASLCAIVVSVVALAAAWRTERRAADRFELQQKETRDIASASVRPLLDVILGGYPAGRSVILRNYGLGPAAITAVAFTKDKSTMRDMRGLVDTIPWDNYWNFRDRTYYLGPADRLLLLAVTMDGLRQHGVPEQEVQPLITRVNEQIRGIEVKISYSDVLGAPQPDLIKVL